MSLANRWNSSSLRRLMFPKSIMASPSIIGNESVNEKARDTFAAEERTGTDKGRVIVFRVNSAPALFLPRGLPEQREINSIGHPLPWKVRNERVFVVGSVEKPVISVSLNSLSFHGKTGAGGIFRSENSPSE